MKKNNTSKISSNKPYFEIEGSHSKNFKDIF